jgi:hypothetical protein
MTNAEAHKNIDWRLAWVTAIREPNRALAWSLSEWERVVRIARRLRLLARLAESIDRVGLMAKVPEAPRRHLVAEQRVSRYRVAAMTWALDRIKAALGTSVSPPVLLKGAAYVGQGLPIAAGRLPSDVDILVPRLQLHAAQRRLLADGWREMNLDAHDQRYYREWSHEVPPMRHPLHPIELDLHHDILPPVAKKRIDIGRMLECVRPCSLTGWQVLHPKDQVLHSAAHLFFDSEVRDRLRDLVDIDGLLCHFGREPEFFPELLDRARELGLQEPLALTAHFCSLWLDTPIPTGVKGELASWASYGMRRLWLLPTLAALLTPVDPDDRPPRMQNLAATLFLVRYHAGRMPLRILVPHISRKMRIRTSNLTAPRDAGGGDVV